MEPDNPHSRFAVAVKNEDDKIVGRVPAEISKTFNKFLSEDGTIKAECIESRFNKARTSCIAYCLPRMSAKSI